MANLRFIYRVEIELDDNCDILLPQDRQGIREDFISSLVDFGNEIRLSEDGNTKRLSGQVFLEDNNGEQECISVEQDDIDAYWDQREE